MRKMRRLRQRRKPDSQGGVALLIAISALLLISVVAISMIVAAGMETSLSGNYRSSTSAYYAARAGLEEGRGRLLPRNPDYFNTTSPAFIPTTLSLGQVRYVTNPSGGEDVLSSYPDTEYDNEFGSGSLAAATRKTIASVSPVGALSGALYKWVRINPITEASINIDVNGDHVMDRANLLFFDGQHLNLNSAGQQALEVTSLAVLPNGTQRMLQYVVAPMRLSLNFPAAVTAVGTYSGSTNFGNQSGGFGVSGADFCYPTDPTKQQFAVAATNGTSVSNLTGKLTPAGNYPGTGASTGPPATASIGSDSAAMQNFPDPVHPGQNLDLTTVAGLNQLVSEIQSAADFTVADCSNPSNLGSTSNPTVVVVTGNCSLSGNPSPPGAGILLVQGDVQYVDHPYDGLILAIGTGAFHQQAARLTHFYGSLVLAQTVNPANGSALAVPGTPALDWLSSNGNPNLQYDSCLLANAQPAITYKPLSFREISQQ
jgi:hypothetical protein